MAYNWRQKSDVLEEDIFSAQRWTPPVRKQTGEVPLWQRPKEWWQKTEETIGEKISSVPILPEILKPVGQAFSWIHENLEKPFASIISAPFSPDIQWKKGESWVDHQKREYDSWDAPTYVKGLAEFSMPLWWVPWFGWAMKGAKSLGVGSKAAAQIAKSGKSLRVSDRNFIPTSQLLDKTIFKSGLTDRFTRWTEKIPGLNRVVKMIGGEKAFAHPTATDPLNVTRRALVKMGFVDNMKDGIRRLTVPKLQVIEHSNKGLGRLLNMDSRGVVGNIVDKSGKSQYLYDVLEGAIKNKGDYRFLTKQSELYVDTLKEVIEDIFKMAKQEGVRVPRGLFLHRVVKGKTSPTGEYVKSEFGSWFDTARTHKTMREGVEQVDRFGRPTPVDYGLDISESISSTVNHYVKAIARKRFNTEVKGLGKTAKIMWAISPEGQRLAELRELGAEGVLKFAKEIEMLSGQRSQFLKHFKGRQVMVDPVSGRELAKFRLEPAFGDRLFPKDVVKTAEKLLQDDGQRWLTNMARVSGTSRMLTAAMDLSSPFIQGLAVAGRNPVAWAGMFKRNLEFFIKPENFYKYLTDPKTMATAAERISHGGSSSTFEFFKALEPLQRQLGKIPIFGKGLKKGVGQTYGRAEVAFSGGGEAARNYMWQALKKPNMSPEQLMDLSRTIDRMTGVMSTEALAIGRTQQDFENAFVFFAPRYTRAGLAFTSDALRGGLAGAEARKSLAALAGGGMSMYYGAAKALGQEANLNPSSGRFMTLEIGGSHIGIGGIMIALMRLGYDVAVTAVEDPINLVKPISEGSLNRWDNPFIRFLYSRTAPLTSTLYGGLVEQSNYFGEPFEDIGDWGKFLADKITPIAAQETTDALYDRLRGEQTELPSPSAIAAEFGGLRVFPKSPWELLDEEKDSISMREFGNTYDNLDDLSQMRVDKFPTIRTLQKDVDAQAVTRGDKESIAWINWERERDAARMTYEGTLNDLQGAYDANAIDGVEFRKKMSDAGYGLGVTYNHISEQPEYKSVMETLREPRKLDDRSVQDIAYAEYTNRLFTKDEQGRSEFEDQFGLFQYDKFNAFIAEFRVKWGDEIYKYVQDIKGERDANLPEMAKEYQKAKGVMKPYWEVESMFIGMYGKTAAETPRGKKVISDMRKSIRMRNPEIERYYQLFYSRQ